MNDIRRIAFVTDRFLQLQGLGPALFGAALIFSTLLHHATGSWSRYTDPFQVLTFAAIIGGQATAPLQRIYRRTYGDVVATWTQKAAAAQPMMLIWGGALADFAFHFDQPRPGPSFAAIALATQSCWVLLRDWRWRLHHVAGAVAGIVAAVITASITAAPERFGRDPGLVEAYLLAYALMGLALVVCGLFDHRLLASSLKPASPVAGDIRSAQRSRLSLLAAALAVAAPALVCLTLSERMLAWALPAMLMVSVLGLTMGHALLQATRAIREFRAGRRPVDSGLVIEIDDDVLAAMMLVTVVAAVDSALFPSLAPLVIAIGGSAAWLALNRWRERKHYWAWTLAAACVLAVAPRLSAARAFNVFLLAMAAAAAIVALTPLATAPKDRPPHADAI
jgi:hypothetical protein